MHIDLLVQPTGKNTAYAALSQAQVDAIRGAPGRGRVNITLGFQEHLFRTSLAIYRGEWMFVVNKEMRAAGLLPGASYPVELIRDLEKKTANPAPDVLGALQGSSRALAAWEKLATSYQREHLRRIENAKRPETRTRRIGKLVETLRLVSEK
jgi:hypothetical protein